MLLSFGATAALLLLLDALERACALGLGLALTQYRLGSEVAAW